MKRNRRRLPIPQHEFGFVPDTFCLIQDAAVDGERISREQAEADHARELAEQTQAALFTPNQSRKTDTMNTNQNDSPFGDAIYTYTRAHAVADGFQIEVTKTAQEAGIRFPVFLTRAVYNAYVTVPPDVAGQDEPGRLWDVVWMLRFAIRKAQPGKSRLPFALYVRNDNRRPRLVKLIATCNALDIGAPRPAITVMMPDED
jgi:hypothetical protein